MSTDTLQCRTLDGRTLTLRSAGTGGRLVVCEAGLGMSGHYWDSVVHALKPHVRILTYERAGFGSSDPDAQPRTLERLASELNSVIASQDYEQLVLLGHSWGAPVVRAAAAGERQEDRGLRVARTVGLIPVLLKALSKGLSAEAQRALIAACSTRSAVQEAREELRYLREGLNKLATGRIEALAVPTTVISGAKAMMGEKTALRQRINGGHRSRAKALPKGRFVLAQNSGHNVPLTEAQVIASEVLHLLTGSSRGANSRSAWAASTADPGSGASGTRVAKTRRQDRE